jgi:hypothetical protein
MGLASRLWDALVAVIRMEDRSVQLAKAVEHQQGQVEDLKTRLLRIETIVDIAKAQKRLEGPS